MSSRGWENVTESDVSRRNAKIAGDGSFYATPTLQRGEAKPSKYRNVRTEVDGKSFDSKAEADYWCLLKARLAAGEIQGLERQVKFPLMCPDVTSQYNGIRHVVSNYVADFVWWESGNLIVADKKGKRTQMYLLKRKWLELQSNIRIIEV